MIVCIVIATVCYVFGYYNNWQANDTVVVSLIA